MSAYIQQKTPNPIPGQGQINQRLSTNHSLTIGREPSRCQIVLDSNYYQGVSRVHVEIKPVKYPTTHNSQTWEVHDYSSNGTFINGQKIRGTHILQSGDVIKLGKKGPEFTFYSQAQKPVTVSNTNIRPVTINPTSSLNLSQVIPIISSKKKWQNLLIPGIATALLTIILFNFFGLISTIDKLDNINRNTFINLIKNVSVVGGIIALFIGWAFYYFLYRVGGKHKPWWIAVAVLIGTLIINNTIFFTLAYPFREILPGNPDLVMEKASQGLITNPFSIVFQYFIAMLCGAGLAEEFTKSIPVFICLFIGLKLKSPWREKVGVWEPLDGILLGAASGIAFTVNETTGFPFNSLNAYVARTIFDNILTDLNLPFPEGLKEMLSILQNQGLDTVIVLPALLQGLFLLFPRVIGSIGGHIAYSGYFGYFIGLSVLKQKKRWLLLTIGYLTSSVIHAFWNTAGVLRAFELTEFQINIIQFIVGLLGYSFLIAAILKGRQLSPNRSQNFATQLYNPHHKP